MEKELENFLKSIIFHFTEKVQHNFTISNDSIELELYSDENWEEIDFRALKKKRFAKKKRISLLVFLRGQILIKVF